MLFACDGLECLNVVKGYASELDAVFMDNVMPNMDGLETTRILRREGYLFPIIGVAGNCLSEQIDDFIQSGATRVLPKPVNIIDLENLMKGNFACLAFRFVIFGYI